MTSTSFGDEGPSHFVTDIEADTLANESYETTRWTGSHLQMTGTDGANRARPTFRRGGRR